MNYHFQDLLPPHFSNDSRIWIYQCNRPFSTDENFKIKELLSHFSNSWLSHGHKVKGFANLFFGQFIIFIADETETGVSGCSTDSSVRLVKSIEEDYQVQLFDRERLAFIIEQKIILIPLTELKEAVSSHMIKPDTLYFNNTIQTLNQLINEWIIPVGNSWLSNRFKLYMDYSVGSSID